MTNLAVSLTPVAADYRAALSISYVPMLVEAVIGGIAKALALCVAVLEAVTAVVEVAAKSFGSVDRPVHNLPPGDGVQPVEDP